MHKRDITFTDFDDQEVTQTHYFNISKTELVRIEAERKGGFTAWMEELIKIEDTPTLMEQFERLILLSYGVKSPDGLHFEKSDEIRTRFKNSAAYDAFFWEIFSDEGKMAEFINAIIPKEARERLAAKMAATQAQTAVSEAQTVVSPTPPTAPAPPIPPTTS